MLHLADVISSDLPTTFLLLHLLVVPAFSTSSEPEMSQPARNVLGGRLEECSTNPVTGAGVLICDKIRSERN